MLKIIKKIYYYFDAFPSKKTFLKATVVTLPNTLLIIIIFIVVYFLFIFN